MFVSSDQSLPYKSTWIWSAVASCVCELILLFSALLCSAKSLHKFQFRFTIKWTRDRWHYCTVTDNWQRTAYRKGLYISSTMLAMWKRTLSHSRSERFSKVEYSTGTPFQCIVMPYRYKRPFSNASRIKTQRFVGFRRCRSVCLLIAEQGT